MNNFFWIFFQESNNLDLLILPVVDADQTFSLSVEYKEESEIKKLFQNKFINIDINLIPPSY